MPVFVNNSSDLIKSLLSVKMKIIFKKGVPKLRNFNPITLMQNRLGRIGNAIFNNVICKDNYWRSR